VYDEGSNAISMARVVPFYPDESGYPDTGDDSDLTDASGQYTVNATPGQYFVRAERDGYFADEFRVDLTCFSTVNQDAQLRTGDCNQYCANWENRCNAQCAGLNFTTSSGTNACGFHDAKARNLCDNRERGSWVEYNQSGDTTHYVQCCEGTPVAISTPEAIIHSTIGNLYKRERVLQSSDTKQPVKLVVNVWNE
jgi:hypothetical protein